MLIICVFIHETELIIIIYVLCLDWVPLQGPQQSVVPIRTPAKICRHFLWCTLTIFLFYFLNKTSIKYYNKKKNFIVLPHHRTQDNIPNFLFQLMALMPTTVILFQ